MDHKRQIFESYLFGDVLTFKCPIAGGIGAPTPIFNPYASYYNLNFIQNASNLHFLYLAKLVICEYVEKNIQKILQYFSEENKTPIPIFEPQISS